MRTPDQIVRSLGMLLRLRPRAPEQRHWFWYDSAAICGCGAVWKMNGSCPRCGQDSSASVLLSSLGGGRRKPLANKPATPGKGKKA